MSPIFKSGAFIQQCFAVHPLCLAVKKLVAPDHLIFSCTSCQLAHRVTIGSLLSHLPGQNEPSREEPTTARERLTGCLESHRTAIGVSGMDVIRERLELRCAECRRLFMVEGAAFETHQRS